MSRDASLIRFDTMLRDGVINGRWEEVSQARERLVEIMLRAHVEQNPAQIRAVQSALSHAQSMMVLYHDVDPEPNGTLALVEQSAMLNAEAQIATAALKLAPQQPDPLTKPQARVHDAILMLLRTDNFGRMSNSDIAKRLKKPLETITRALMKLRSDGSVDSWRIGQEMANQLTDSGRAKADVLIQQDRQRDTGELKFPQLLRLGDVAETIKNCIGAVSIWPVERKTAAAA
jgi:hypothetical protein